MTPAGTPKGRGLSGTLCKWRDLRVHDRGSWAGEDHVHDYNRVLTEVSVVPAARSVPLVAGDTPAMREWAEQLVARARAEGVELTGDDGLLTAMIRQVLQTGLEVELSDHLGYEPHDPAGRGSGQQPQRDVAQDGHDRCR